MGESYYEVLGVSVDATGDEIRTAYRERVLETHPDRNDDPDAAEQFKRVAEAESVLTDETERARYDRLGHDAYVRWGNHFPGSDGGDDADGETGDDGVDPRDAAAAATAGGAGDATGGGTAGDSSGGAGAGTSTGGTGNDSSGPWWEGRGPTDDDGPSHHARQRYRRERRTAAADGRWFDGESTRRGSDPADGEGASRDSEVGGTTWSAGRTGSATGTSGGGTDSTAGTSVGGMGSAGGRRRGRGRSSATRSGGFAVHGWDDEIDLASPYESFDRPTAVVLACLSLVYPLLVYASLSPQFHLFLNAIVACCTLVLVGYLLTKPRVALVAFGGWGVLVALGMAVIGPVHPLSLGGALAVAAFWVPFGYAAAVWWALRP